MAAFQCSECGKPIGLMADKEGNPRPFRCPHTGRVAEPQIPVARKTAPLSLVGRLDVLRQLRIEGKARRDEKPREVKE